MFESTTALILAAGAGTRMKSSLPKVLHSVAGAPLLYFPVRAALDAGCGEVIVVVGHGRDQVEQYLAQAFASTGRVRTAYQREQRGTGDAARAGLEAVRAEATRVLVYYGDVPLLTARDLTEVMKTLDGGAAPTLAMATCTTKDPSGYGRILRDEAGYIVEVREQRDLRTDAERAVCEWNPGVYATTRDGLAQALPRLRPDNAQHEYYLTDIVKLFASEGGRVVGVASRPEVMEGVNDREQLAAAERVLRKRIVTRHRLAGVTVREGALIDESVVIEAEATIESFAVLRGSTHIGARACVEIGCVVTNSTVGPDAVLKPYSVITDSVVGLRAHIGPFSHLRPQSDIGEAAHVGNFVETKKTTMGKGAKANHLAYLGDGIVGERANIGAGTIFCNYDGVAKHTTHVGAYAFVGSDSQLVAPVRVGDRAYVATGTTVTRDVPDDALAIGRARQENKEGYASRLRAKQKADANANANADADADADAKRGGG